MVLTSAEEPVVLRAVEAYREARLMKMTGRFTGLTADQILEELAPTPVRWAELASFVIEQVERPAGFPLRVISAAPRRDGAHSPSSPSRASTSRNTSSSAS
jgi:hypothetical protein